MPSTNLQVPSTRECGADHSSTVLLMGLGAEYHHAADAQLPGAQARDNVKFLTTLERHFRSISASPLTGILDTLPLLMNALRMIWIISRYYSDDAHMGGLFARIGVELCDRVNGAIMLHTLFRMPADEAVELLRVSKAVLECWQNTYMQVCEMFSVCKNRV